jgi:hypothetical protein
MKIGLGVDLRFEIAVRIVVVNSIYLSASLAAESSKGFTELSGILIRPIRSREIDHIAIQLAHSIPIR